MYTEGKTPAETCQEILKIVPQRTRYQAAIFRDGEILLIKHREHASGRAYWLLPGGGIEPDETENACVQREVREETNLEVKIDSLLLDELLQDEDNGPYLRFKTYLCSPVTSEASPGYEPEPEAAEIYAIVEIGWFNIQDETAWDELILSDPRTLSVLRRVRMALEEKSSSQT